MTAPSTPAIEQQTLQQTQAKVDRVFIATHNALLMCTLSMTHLEQLRALFSGIVAASNKDATPYELAKLGLFLVDDFHNTMDCNREENQNYLCILSKEQS